MKTAYLLDAYALIYRAYYAFLRTPRINSKGVNTSAIFGFVNTVVDVLSKRKPDYIAVAFDMHGDTFRHEMYKEYKAQREAQPEDIRIAVPYIKDFLKAMNITVVECKGYEADDIIGTLSNRLRDKVDMVFMMTPDKDYAQLVKDNVKMYRPSTSGAEEWGLAEIQEHFGVERAEQIIDLLGLWGDSSDNIPGCPGVGEKRAKELLASYGSIDGIYEHIDELKGKMKDNFQTNKDLVMLSRKLATIITDAPVDFDFDNSALKAPNKVELQKLFAELEFRNVMPRIEGIFETNVSDLGGLFAQDANEDPTASQEVAEEIVLKTYKDVEHEYIVVQTDAELQKLAEELRKSSLVCFDTETTNIDAMQADIVGLSFATMAHKAYYIPFNAEEGLFAQDNYGDAKRKLEFFKDIFESTSIAKVGQNMKYDMLVLSYYGIEVKGTLFDTMIAHFLLYPGQRHNMDDMAATMLRYQPISIESLIGKGSQQKSMKDVPLESIKEYAAEDADITLQLWFELEKKMNEHSQILKLFSDIEMPLMPVLADMEKTGVKLDSSAMQNFSIHLKEQIVESEKMIYEYAGETFNIGSPKQVGEILFEKLKIDASAKKTKTGQYSTSEETLQKLAHDNPIAAEILNYRGLLKLLNTYSEALPKLVNERTGRIHTSFNQTVVITGRLSSTNPNLQNIPIRDENGKEIRKAFVATDDKHVLLAADYSQVELRLMAHFSNDEHLIAAFKRGEDIHAATAAKVFKVDLDDVTKDMRRKAKTANFGIIYGISAFGLAERLDIPRKEAKEIIDGYFESFGGVREYMDKCIEDAKTTGAVTTIFGRRRELDDINSKNSVVRGVAERNAINAPIQGTAADIIKIAMIDIHKALIEKDLKAKMILQVHDELVFDTPLDEVDAVKQLVCEKMENACKLSVPLVAEVGVGNNWLEAH